MREPIIQVDASEVQGKGAFIKWKRLTWGERKAVRDLLGGITVEQQTAKKHLRKVFTDLSFAKKEDVEFLNSRADDLQQTIQDCDDRYTVESRKFLLSRLVDWNWVDEDGKPLPVPKSADDLETLMSEEIDWLYKVIARSLAGTLERSAEAVKN